MTNHTGVAAVYARKSDDNPQGVELQVEAATEFILSKGWALGPVFKDNDISGAKESRPGLDAMLEALSGRPKPFTAVVMMNGDRLSRGTISKSLALQQLILQAGVSIWFYQSGQQVVLKTATDELKGAIDAYGARDYREQVKKKTRSALRQKFLQGHVAGAKIFGYNNDHHGEGKARYTTRSIHPEQAAVVQRIFRMYTVDMLGVKTIASTLAIEGVPAPRKGGWTDGGIAYMVQNDAYTGRVRFGAQRTEDREDGTTTLVPGDPIDRMDDSLRIVDLDTFKKAQAVRAERGGVRPDRPRAGGKNRYLLSGNSTCAICGGSVRVQVRGFGSGDKVVTKRVYVCSTRESKGSGKCTNASAMLAERLEEAVIASISKYLDEGVLLEAVEAALGRLTERSKQAPAHRAALEGELKGIESQLENLVGAIAGGKAPASILRAIADLESKQEAIKQELAGLEQKVASLDRERVRKQLRGLAKDTRELLTARTRQSRAMLYRILGGGKLVVTPLTDGQKGVAYSGVLVFGDLIGGELGTCLTASNGSGSSISRGRMGRRVEPGQGAAGPAHSLPDGPRASVRSRASD